jgi:hypothetical protein
MKNNKTKYLRSKQYYSSTSHAYKIEPKETTNKVNKTQKGNKKAKKPVIHKNYQTNNKRQVKHNKKLKYKTFYKIKYEEFELMSTPSAISVALVFFILLGLSHSYAVTLQKQAEIGVLNRELFQANETKRALEMEIARGHNMAEVEYIATNILGMSRPGYHQIIYLEIDRDRHITRSESRTQAQPEERTIRGFFRQIINIQ